MTVTSPPTLARGRRLLFTRRRWAGAATALVLLVATMAATGIGTGAGPLGEGGGARIGVSRAAPATLTTALTLQNAGRFDVHLQSIRPLPRSGAAEGMPVVEVSMTIDRDAWAIGLADGTAEAEVPRTERHVVDGYVIPATDPSPTSGAVALATFRIVADGEWRYDGYEITYRHGWVRHKTRVGIALVGCTTPIDTCVSSD